MKKLSFLLTIIILFSCSSDDSSSASVNYETLIVGKWKLVERGSVVDGQEVPSPFLNAVTNPDGTTTDYSYCIEEYVIFLSTNIYQGFNEVCSDYPWGTYTYSGNWEIVENNLLLTDGSGLNTVKIQTLNSTTLNIQSVAGNSVSYTIFNKVN